MSIDLPPHPTPADEQPPPTPNDEPHIADIVCADLTRSAHLGAGRRAIAAEVRHRKRLGIQRYGTPLQAHNGRFALADLLDELVDALQYARQHLVEVEGTDPDDPDLGAMRTVYADLCSLAVAVHGHKVRRVARNQLLAERERAEQAAQLAALVEAGYAAARHAAQESGDA